MWKYKINICGIPHEVIEVDAPELGTEYPMGEIDYGNYIQNPWYETVKDKTLKQQTKKRQF